ncbi:MAG: bifunctional phosphoglucose/phosphomannose isomerase [Candidatus Omnitrophota bacterium]
MKLDSMAHIKKIDTERMIDFLLSFPTQCRDAVFIGENTFVSKRYRKRFNNVVFTGLGGSAIGADVIKAYIGDEVGVPIFVNRDYKMPGFVDKRSLVFAVSYSGDTEETLSAYNEAKARGANIIAVTSGGKIEERALKNQDVVVKMPKGFPPRCALGYSFIPAVVILSKLGMLRNKSGEIKKAASFLSGLQEERLGPQVKGQMNIAKSIAQKIYRRFPVIYSSFKISGVATRWRGQLAENSKTLSSTHVFPEMNHNEIVGWEEPRTLLRNFTAIILKDRDDHPRIKERMRITASILRKNRFKTIEIESMGATLLDRILSLIYIGDFTSFYLAVLNNVDPTPVSRIDYLKKQLAK